MIMDSASTAPASKVFISDAPCSRVEVGCGAHGIQCGSGAAGPSFADWRGLGLDEEVLAGVLHGNAERLFAEVKPGRR